MGEFLETRHDKFIFTVKKKYSYSKDDFWANVENHQAVVGVSDFLQQVKGDVVFLETIEPGTTVKQGQEIGKIETIKATFGILSPVSGKVVEVNPELESNPNLINESPYGTGWLYRIELGDFETDKKSLLNADTYFELMKGKIAEEVRKKTAKPHKKVVVLACSGIGRTFGAVAREIVYEIIERVRPGVAVTTCLPLLAIEDQDAKKLISENPVITIDGCTRSCAGKSVEFLGVKPAKAYQVINLYKEHKDLKPDGLTELNDAGKKLAAVAADEMAQTIDELAAQEVKK